NICRSPAEAVFRNVVNKRGLDSKFHIDSAGTIGYQEGNKADSRMRSASKKRGIESWMAAPRGINQLLRRALQNQSSGPSLLSSLRGNHEESSAGLKALALLGVGASGLLSFATIAHADEAEHGLAAPDSPWQHAGIMSSYDHASSVVGIKFTRKFVPLVTPCH
ncbi:hypothetical protein EJB05_47680, partial [Eragrostis curvula]